MLTKTLDTIAIEENILLIDCLVALQLAQSRREAREFILNGAVSVNDEKIIDLNYSLSKQHALHDLYVAIRRGKKKFAIAKFI